MNQSKKLITREQQNKENIWKLEDIFSTNDDWEVNYKEITNLTNDIEKYKGNLNESANILLECLKKVDELQIKLSKVFVYAHMRSHEDMGNSKYQSLADRATSLEIQVSSALSFIEPEILSIDDNTLKEFIAENADLKFYDKYLKNLLRIKEHVLPPEQEFLLAQASELATSPQTIFNMFNNADIKFPSIKDDEGNDIEVTHGRFINLMENKNRKIRKDAFESVYSSFINHKNTLAATYSANVKADIFFAKSKKYSSSLHASLDQNNIDTKVYDQLINTVNDNVDSLHKYVDIRKDILGVDQLHMYDLYTPIVKDIDIKIPFEQAKNTVKEALAVLGEEYICMLQKGFDNHWIDVYENKGKKSGAYSWGTYSSHPFVLLNYQDNVNNMFTLAHEMGHAMHSFYSNREQEYRYSNYPLFLAEVASTVNEALLMNHLLKTTEDPNYKRYLLNYYIEQFRTTLYRQTMFAEFEKIAHELVEKGQSLTSESLCRIYHDLNVKYYGNSIVVDPEIDMEWARIPHFYRSFYVYQYSTGYSAAIALSQKILNEGQSGVNDYLTFLKSGCSDYPLNILRKAGVDMTTKEPISQALNVFKSLVEKFN